MEQEMLLKTPIIRIPIPVIKCCFIKNGGLPSQLIFLFSLAQNTITLLIMLNFYFVKPETPNYEAKRDAFMQLKTINEGVLHVGMTVQKKISKRSAIYVLGSISPMLTDTETERLSKGFAFCDILALGYTLDLKYFALDVRPSFRHTSNAGLNTSNAGFNTKNIELGIIFPL